MPRWLTGVVAAAGVAAIGAIAALLLIVDLGESAGREEGVTLRDVAGDPAGFAGQAVTISGEIAENDFFSLADADVVFALGDDADGTVLVFPQGDAEVPELEEDTAVRVRGTVREIEPQASSAGGFVDRAGLLAASGAEAVIEASTVEIVARNPNEPPPVRPSAPTVTVGRLLAEPADFADGPVRVPGTVATVLQNGFLLRGDSRTVFVGAPASDLRGLAVGEQVRVRAEIARLSRWRARVIQEEAPRAAAAPGDLFLVLRAFAPAAR